MSAEDLARRVVACKGFRWMPGMLALASSKHWPEHAPEPTRVDERQLSFDGQPVNDQWTAVPDLADPATLGCLLALVREAWDWRIWVESTVDGWKIGWPEFGPGDGRALIGWIEREFDSEAEALVCALEASP